jgi:hypothetical protein
LARTAHIASWIAQYDFNVFSGVLKSIAGSVSSGFGGSTFTDAGGGAGTAFGAGATATTLGFSFSHPARKTEANNKSCKVMMTDRMAFLFVLIVAGF